MVLRTNWIIQINCDGSQHPLSFINFSQKLIKFFKRLFDGKPNPRVRVFRVILALEENIVGEGGAGGAL